MPRSSLVSALMAGVVALACCTCRATGDAAPAPATPPAASSAPSTPTASAQGPVEGPAPVVSLPAGGLLLPPATAGESISRLAGCLSEAASDEAAGARHPVVATRSRGAAPEVAVSALGHGVIVAHDLQHACCLKGAVETRVDGATVRVRETLSGSPCRCLCRSTLKTAVALAPGAYTVEVVLVNGGSERTVATEQVSVGR